MQVVIFYWPGSASLVVLRYLDWFHLIGLLHTAHFDLNLLFISDAE